MFAESVYVQYMATKFWKVHRMYTRKTSVQALYSRSRLVVLRNRLTTARSVERWQA